MAAGSLSREAGNLLRRHVDSLEMLETLLLLERAPSRSWSAHAVAAELGGPVNSALRCLERLCARGFLDVQTTSELMHSAK